MVAGNQIIGDRRNWQSDYDLDESYGPALNEHEKVRKGNGVNRGTSGAHSEGSGKRRMGTAKAGTGGRSERTAGTGCAADLGGTYPDESTQGDEGNEGERARMVRPFICLVEYDRHPFLWERCEGDKCQERDKLRVEGTIAKLDMLCRLSTIQRTGKRIYRLSTRQTAVTRA